MVTPAHVPFLTTDDAAADVAASLAAVPGVEAVHCDVWKQTVEVRCRPSVNVESRALLLAAYRAAPARCGLEPVTFLADKSAPAPID